MQGIFISYRRQDSQSAAGRLADDIKENLAGVPVFRDVETIQPGMDFVEVINHALQSCGVLLAVIGPRWISAQDSAGRRRLDNPDDYTRIEIATALKRGDVRVIPVLVEGAQMPEPGDLPEDLRALARRNALELTDNRWNFDVSRLVATVRQALGVPDPNWKTQWRWPAAAIGALVVAGYMGWQWRTPPVPAITPPEAAISALAVTPPTSPNAQNSHTSATDHRVPSIQEGEGQAPANGSEVQKPQAGACEWLFSPGGAGNFRKLAVGPPLAGLRFGDFDGDGKTDVFAVAEKPGGAHQWMYSPGGVGNFQNLAVGPPLADLRFGDFDGDGKTDVFAVAAQSGGAHQWMFSSGGAGNFQNLGVGPPLAGLRFGDFDGDGKTDVFAVAEKPGGAHQWMFSPGGAGDFQNLAVGPPLTDLRFGDFDGDGKTDVFAVAAQSGGAHQWMFSSGGAGNFQNLAVGPPLAGLRFGDFDGDGKTDVFAVAAQPGGAHQWLFSSGGAGNFQNLRVGPPLADLGFGDFDGNRRTDVFSAVCR